MELFCFACFLSIGVTSVVECVVKLFVYRYGCPDTTMDGRVLNVSKKISSLLCPTNCHLTLQTRYVHLRAHPHYLLFHVCFYFALTLGLTVGYFRRT